MSKIYFGTDYSKKEVGEVSPDGTVYSGAGILSATRGRVDADGKVYTDKSELVGEVSQDGIVYSTKGLFKVPIGEVSDDGTVYSGTGFLKRPIGKVGEDSNFGMLGNIGMFLNPPLSPEKKPSRVLPEGAALLLLFDEQSDKLNPL